jgi:hypothetical protein
MWASRWPLWSRITKHAGCSSTDQGGGKALRRGPASHQEPSEVPNKLDPNQSFCRDRCDLMIMSLRENLSGSKWLFCLALSFTTKAAVSAIYQGVIDRKMRSKQMFGKRQLVDTLNRDLARARNKRDTLASSVTTLTTQIAELEVRLSAENERLARERAASKIERIKKDVTDRYLAFVPVIGGIRDATEVAAAIVPEAHEVNESLDVIATEVAKAIDRLSVELDRRIEAARAGKAAPELPQSLTRSLEFHPAK